MQIDTARQIIAACEQAADALDEAEKAILAMPDCEERSQHLKVVANIFGDIFGLLRLPAIKQFPELNPPQDLGSVDTLLDEEELAVVTQFSSSDIHAIDTAITSNCTTSWRKVASVIGTAMPTVRKHMADVPIGYYAQRVIDLVNNGRLEAQGNLDYIRFSEVRLPKNVTSS